MTRPSEKSLSSLGGELFLVLSMVRNAALHRVHRCARMAALLVLVSWCCVITDATTTPASFDPQAEERALLRASTVLEPLHTGSGFVKVVAGGYFSATLDASGTAHLRGMGGPERTLNGPWRDVSAGTYVLLLLDTSGRLFALDVRDASAGLVALPVPHAVQPGLFGAGHDFWLALDAATGVVTKGHADVRTVVSLPAVSGQGVTALCCGSSYALMLTDAGAVYGHGSNVFGQLARGDDVRDEAGWGAVELPSPVAQVACGGDHALALTRDGRVYAWGWAEKGQLGTGGPLPSAPRQMHTPQHVAALDGVAVGSVAAGGYAHSYAVGTDGALYSWGWDELDGDTWTPQRVANLNVSAVASGSFKHTAALDARTGALVTYGNDWYAQVRGASAREEL